jgi:hypothetical protein
LFFKAQKRGGRLTKRERIECAINFETPDRVPYVDSFQNAPLIHHYTNSPMINSWTTKQVIELASRVADMVQGWGLGSSMSSGVRSVDRHGITWRTNHWYSEILERPFTSAGDFAAAIEKEINLVRKSTPDYPDTRQKMFLDDDLLMAPVKEFKNIFKEYLTLLKGTVLMYPDVSPGLDHLYTLGGWELFTELFFGNPGILTEYMETVTKMQVKRAHAIADVKLSPVVLIACDIAHKEGPLVSPDFLNQHYFPRVGRIAAAYQEHGLKVFYHSEGNLWSVMEDIYKTGIDGLNPLEPDSHMNEKQLRKEYPGLVLWGGVDNSFLLVAGSPENVRKRVEELIDFGKQGGLLIGSTGQTHPACRLDNLVMMIETIRKQNN